MQTDIDKTQALCICEVVTTTDHSKKMLWRVRKRIVAGSMHSANIQTESPGLDRTTKENTLEMLLHTQRSDRRAVVISIVSNRSGPSLLVRVLANTFRLPHSRSGLIIYLNCQQG
jgi:hypothetical protein